MRLVQKYGGTSVGSPERIRAVARRVAEARRRGHDLVVVVSAMGDTTDDLTTLAELVCGRERPQQAHPREMDMLLTAGERIAAALLTMAIREQGFEARSFTGSQAAIITDTAHTAARIREVRGDRVKEALEAGCIAIVAGFQGVTTEKDITTLGRGGSDTTAVALAAALDADTCEIYTDVDGIFTADPRVVPRARRIPRVTGEEMLELAAGGAKVLHIRAVEYARRHGVTLHVRSSFSNKEGTIVYDPAGPGLDEKGNPVEEAVIAGVATDLGEAKITVVGVRDEPGKAAELFTAVARTGANIDMIVQNVSAAATGLTDISFTLPKGDAQRVLGALTSEQGRLGFTALQHDDQIGKLSLVGAGMRTNAGVSAQLFTALADAGINIEMISTSEIRISVVTRADLLQSAVRAVHSAFGLDGEAEAVVYAGTGR